MPVSKKRKKDGKPVYRPQPAPAGDEGAPAPEGKLVHPDQRMGKPRNPFVAQQQQAKRGAQRGR